MKSTTFSIAAMVIIVVSLLIIALMRPLTDSASGSPYNLNPVGLGALYEILKDQGIDVDVTRNPDAVKNEGLENTTVVIPDEQARRMNANDVTAIRSTAGKVVILALGPTGRYDDWGLEGRIIGMPSQIVAATCSTADGRAVRSIGPASRTYETATTECFPTGNGAVVVSNENVTLVADAAIFNNTYLAQHGNAALGLRLLGTLPNVLWLHPSAGVASGPEASDITPRSTGPALLAIAFVLAGIALYRGRRFGPLVAEPLPVVVPSHESTLGRARLYESSGDPEHAAAALRAATIDHIAARTGLSRNAHPADVVATCTSISDKSEAWVRDVLYERAIKSTDDLHILRQDLNTLEEKS